MQRNIKIYVAILILICSLTSCATQTHTKQNNIIEESEPTPTPVACAVDYVDVLRNPEKYDGEFISVAGQVTYFKGRSPYNFYFKDCLGRPEDWIGFLVYLDYSNEQNGSVNVGDYIIVEGIWKSGDNCHLSNAVVVDGGESAKQIVLERNSTWLDEGHQFAQTLPMISFETLIQHKEDYKEQYIRTVGVITSVGFNDLTNYVYFRFGDSSSSRNYVSISLEGCPKEMQNMCIEGEYAVLTGKVRLPIGYVALDDCYIDCIGEKAKAAYDALMHGQPVISPTQQVTQNGQYVASADSDKFHRLSCRWAEKILPANAIYFSGIDEALAAGYGPCHTCNP